MGGLPSDGLASAWPIAERSAADATDPVEVEYHNQIVRRSNDIVAGFLHPLLLRLDDVHSQYLLWADEAATPLDDLDVQSSAYELASAVRNLDIAEELRAMVKRWGEELDALANRVRPPLAVMSLAQQYAFWLNEVRKAGGARQRCEYSPASIVEISTTYIHDNAPFLESLCVDFVQRWTAGINAARATAEEANPSDPGLGEAVSLDVCPSVMLFTLLPDLPLSLLDAVTLIAIGAELGLWEAVAMTDPSAVQFNDAFADTEWPVLRPTRILGGSPGIGR